MILTKEVITSISHLNIDYYKSIGFVDIKCNHKILIPIECLPKESNIKVLVKCDICGSEKELLYQKYNKNISKYNLYTCSTTCAQFKIKKTNLEKYGDSGYVNVDMQRKNRKAKFDKITEEIEGSGFINCIKCLVYHPLCEFLVRNGRYKHICRICRNEKSYKNRNKSPHIKAWRSVLRGYLQRINVKKSDKTFNLLKYSPEELRDHISSLFVDGMSWDNYGDWHIDHIVHVTLFKLDTPCYIVNGLFNLRPLNSKLNISRHNNLDDDCLEIIGRYKTYIKEEYIIKNKI